MILTWKVVYIWVWLFLDRLIFEVDFTKANVEWASTSSQLLKSIYCWFSVLYKKLPPIKTFIVFLFYIVNERNIPHIRKFYLVQKENIEFLNTHNVGLIVLEISRYWFIYILTVWIWNLIPKFLNKVEVILEIHTFNFHLNYQLVSNCCIILTAYILLKSFQIHKIYRSFLLFEELSIVEVAHH